METRHFTETHIQTNIYRSQQRDRGSGLRAGKIKDVVTIYNKTIKRSCLIIIKKMYEIVLTKARSDRVYYFTLMLPVRYFYYT